MARLPEPVSLEEAKREWPKEENTIYHLYSEGMLVCLIMMASLDGDGDMTCFSGGLEASIILSYLE
jgi:hypothetical protein